MHCFYWAIYQSEYFITRTCITYSNVETKHNRYEKQVRWNKLATIDFKPQSQFWWNKKSLTSTSRHFSLLTLYNTHFSPRVLELKRWNWTFLGAIPHQEFWFLLFHYYFLLYQMFQIIPLISKCISKIQDYCRHS